MIKFTDHGRITNYHTHLYRELGHVHGSDTLKCRQPLQTFPGLLLHCDDECILNGITKFTGCVRGGKKRRRNELATEWLLVSICTVIYSYTLLMRSSWITIQQNSIMSLLTLFGSGSPPIPTVIVIHNQRNLKLQNRPRFFAFRI